MRKESSGSSENFSEKIRTIDLVEQKKILEKMGFSPALIAGALLFIEKEAVLAVVRNIEEHKTNKTLAQVLDVETESYIRRFQPSFYSEPIGVSQGVPKRLTEYLGKLIADNVITNEQNDYSARDL